jgi:hypothetical protein
MGKLITKQVRNANRKQQLTPFKEGDLVYISTRNMSIPKGFARKLSLKFIGPYPITGDFGNSSYHLELSPNLRRKGVYDVFHASLLKIHVPNNDQLFLGWSDNQVFDSLRSVNEWAVDKILDHSGQGASTQFKILWKTGDRLWLPFSQISHLRMLKDYFEAVGV